MQIKIGWFIAYGGVDGDRSHLYRHRCDAVKEYQRILMRMRREGDGRDIAVWRRNPDGSEQRCDDITFDM